MLHPDKASNLKFVVKAGGLAHIHHQRFEIARLEIEAGIDDVLGEPAAMPHTQVAISMKTRYHRDPAHRWTTNDIADIDAMSVAYAYCDAVFTDKAARSAFADSKELRVFRGA